MGFSERVSGRGDIAAIEALLARADPRLLKADAPASVLVTALPLIAGAQPALVVSGSCCVAEEEAGAIIGAGGWSAAIPGRAGSGASRRANACHVVTDDRALRRGVGRPILSRAMAEARGAGMGWMHCPSTRTALPFCAAMGFSALRAVTLALAPGIDLPRSRCGAISEGPAGTGRCAGEGAAKGKGPGKYPGPSSPRFLQITRGCRGTAGGT